MKTIIRITLVFTLVIFSLSEVSAQWSNEKVVGNGNVTTNTVSTSDYSAIKGIGSIDIHLEKGTEGNIRVETDSNLQEYVEIEVENGALKISTRKNVSLKSKKGIHVYVPFMDIEAISITGSGDIDSKDPVKENELKIKVTGSGDVNLAVDTNELEVKITGSGDVMVSGRTKDLDVTITGSGDFEANSLTAATANAQVSGSGDASINVSDYLNARVFGSGSIKYTGNPDKRDTKVSGSGRISSN